MQKIIQNIGMTFLLFVSFISCAQEPKTQFDQTSLDEVMINTINKDVVFSDILEQHKGKIILIDVWASWCKDCIVGLPKVKALQEQHKDVVFLFLSMDKSFESWIVGVEKHLIYGEHYLIKEGMKGTFGKSIDLDWIPRYMIVDQQGNIALYKAIEADDAKITTTLKNLKSKK